MRKFRVPVPPPPKRNYKITIKNTGETFEVDATKVPYGKHGLPGSILDVMEHSNPDLIDHACGGVQACSTCHVYVNKGLETCEEASEREEDYLDKARGTKLNSRLACCFVPNGDEDVELEIPEWNVNFVKEGH